MESTPKVVDYTGKTALVTGAASGIGRALAAALAARGARLILVDVNESGLSEVAAGIGADPVTIVADLADPGEPDRVLEEAFGAAGMVDLLCSNAGITWGRRMIRENLEAARRMFEINFFASLRFAQAYAKALETEGGRGRMLLTCSEQSLSLPPTVTNLGFGMYSATKHALLVAAEWMREEFDGRTPIDVHVLLPGPIPTAMGQQVRDSLGAEYPAGGPSAPLQYITPERGAELALAGIDLGLFYIPTHPHIADDMRPRNEAVRAAIDALGLG